VANAIYQVYTAHTQDIYFIIFVQTKA